MQPSPFAATERMPVMPMDASIANFLELMSALKDVLAAENSLLRRGLPAALVDLNDEKMRLANEYEESTQEFLAQHAQQIVEQPELYRQVVTAGRELHALTSENMQRLTAAMDATRARIDAVMAAIRTHDGFDQTYGRTGQRPANAVTFLRRQNEVRGRTGSGFKA